MAMILTAQNVFPVMATGFALWYAIWKASELGDGHVSEDTRLQIAVSILDLEVKKAVLSWPRIFLKTFNSFFGNEHFSWLCLRRSLAVSTILMLTACLLTFVSTEAAGKKYPSVGAAILGTMLMFSSFSLLVDYFSLLKTRILLKWAARATDLKGLIAPLVCDLLFGYLFLAFLTAIGMSVLAFHTNGFGVISYQQLSAIDSFFFVWELFVREPLSVFKLSTLLFDLADPRVKTNVSLRPLFVLPVLFSSLWMWLFATSGAIIRATALLDPFINWYRKKMDIEKKPIGALGFISGGLVAMSYWLWVTVVGS